MSTTIDLPHRVRFLGRSCPATAVFMEGHRSPVLLILRTASKQFRLCPLPTERAMAILRGATRLRATDEFTTENTSTDALDALVVNQRLTPADPGRIALPAEHVDIGINVRQLVEQRQVLEARQRAFRRAHKAVGLPT